MNSLKTKNVKIVEKFVLFLCISLAVIAAGVVMMFVGALKRGMADMEEDGRLMAEQIDKLLSSLPTVGLR